MAQFYEMPAVSPTMEFGTLVAWRIKEGEKFAPQTVMAEVGTDKANMEAEIFESGVLIKHLAKEGDEVPAGFPIAIIGQSANEDISALLQEYEARKAASGKATAPPTPPPPAAAAVVIPQASVSAPPSSSTTTETRSWMGKTLSPNVMDPRLPGQIKLPVSIISASPLAKKIAEDQGLDLRKITGSGPFGRIVAADLEGKASTPVPVRADESVRHSPMRKTIAKRLLASHQEIPSFTLTVSLNGQGFVDFRTELKRRLPETKISYNDLTVACVARALREFPKANASWHENEVVRHGRVDVGIAVAVPEGLITPVLRNADAMSLSVISETTRELAKRAREGKLKPEEYTDSTFTISNLGMYDIQHFTAIINPPNAAILAVGSLAQVPVVENSALAVGWRMNATLTCDHRLIDGALGAEFLQVLRKYIESPTLLLV